MTRTPQSRRTSQRPRCPLIRFARGQASSVELHEAYLWLRSGRFSMVEALLYLAATGAVNTMIGAQEAVIAAAQETPEPPEQDT